MPSEAEISGEWGFGLQKFPTQKLIFPYICSKKKAKLLDLNIPLPNHDSHVMTFYFVTSSPDFYNFSEDSIFETLHKWRRKSRYCVTFCKPGTHEITSTWATTTLHLTNSTIHLTFTLHPQLSIFCDHKTSFSRSTLFPPYFTLLIFSFFPHQFLSGEINVLVGATECRKTVKKTP